MFSIEFDPKSLEGLLIKARNLDPKDQGKAIYRSFRDSILLVERALKGNVSGSALNVRSGRLRSSLGSKVEADDNGLVGTVGSGVRSGDRVKYANIHEGGGTITPRIKQFLTIPLDAAKTPSGVTRFSADDVRKGRTNYKGSFIKNSIIFGVLQRGNAKRNSIVPLFVLKKSVNIRPSKYLSITAEETLKDATKTLLDGVNEDLSGDKQ
jgi:hypothetical protein